MCSSEVELVQRLVNREARAMNEFHHRYRAALCAAVLRIVRNRQSAEDVLQESMVKVWYGIASYDADQSRLFTWAARVCCNTAIDHVRTGRYRLMSRTASLDDTLVEFFPAPVDFRPEHIGVADLLRGLRPEYRQVLELLYLQGYTQLETAEAMHVPVGTVKTWAVSARRQLSRLSL